MRSKEVGLNVDISGATTWEIPVRISTIRFDSQDTSLPWANDLGKPFFSLREDVSELVEDEFLTVYNDLGMNQERVFIIRGHISLDSVGLRSVLPIPEEDMA